MAIRARYKGKNPAAEFHHGIPARNLEEEEYQALDADQRKLVRESPLYNVKTDAELSGPPASSSAKKKDDGGKPGS